MIMEDGLITIQRNWINSQLSFNKNWREYGEGFGDLNKNFWTGIELMHTLTQKGQWEVRVDYQKIDDETWSHLHYNQFIAGSASEEYPLTVGGFTEVGTDQFTSHNGMKLSTPYNDKCNSDNCADEYESGWWYFNCYYININYQPPLVCNNVLFSEIKIRPKDYMTQ